MKILFLWVESFKNLQRLSLSFCSEYEYDFNSQSKKLSRKRKSALPIRLLDKHISNITGVLGENGAGKSNLLELICLATKAVEDITSNYFLVYEDEGKLFYYSSNKKPDNIEVLFDIQADLEGLLLGKLNVVFFSNVYDENYLNLGPSIQDVSVNKKARYFGRRGDTKNKFIEDLHFIKSDVFNYLNYPSPKKATIKINTQFWNRYSSRSLQRDEFGLVNQLRDYYLSVKRSEFSSRQNSCNIIKLSFLTKIFSELNSNTSIEEVFKSFTEKHELNSESIDELINDVCNLLTRDGFIDEGISEAISDLDSYLESLDFEELSKNRNFQIQFTIKFNKKNINKIERVSNLLHYIENSDMQWYGLSSGQRAYINLFSSIWNALKDNIHSDALVCIDEGDLYLHPQLQLEFIEKLVFVLPHFSEREIQIIITTHSPLLVTDLPRQNLTILMKDENGITRTRQSDNTFGANIFDIYRHTFDLDNQRMGNFSQKYINRIIEILDMPELTDLAISDLEASLEIIGDKLLIHHIEKKLNKYKQLNSATGGEHD